MTDPDLFWQKRALQQVGLFHGLGSEDLLKIHRLARTLHTGSELFFFHQGDAANLLYVLLQGQVKLTQLASDGSQQLLRFIQSGEMFGGIAGLGDATYPVSAQAVQDCVVMVWDTATVLHLMEVYPRMALNAMRHLAQRIQELQQRNLELATERVERRIAHALLRLAHASGRKVEAGILIALPLSRQDLAEMTGTTLYTVSRTLSAWQQKGLVEIGRERVLIRNPHALVSIAQDLPAALHE